MDVVYCEKPKSLPTREMVLQLSALVKTGKLRHWGVLNWSAGEFAEAHEIAVAERVEPPCAAQLPYSIVQRSPVEDVMTKSVLRSAEIGVVASYALHGGLLTGKYSRTEIQDTIRFKSKDVQAMRNRGMIDRANKVIRVAQEVGCTPAQLSLAYCLKNENVSSVLFGATSVTQLQSNLRALEVATRLNNGILRSLRAI
jgi:aryl-alcohol dehydrogenase-like predicted oxidoreductase